MRSRELADHPVAEIVNSRLGVDDVAMEDEDVVAR
jgi:hypothetical protein